MNLKRSLSRLATEFRLAGIDFALIGGLALAARGALRTTGDIDLLVSGDRAAEIDAIMRELAFDCIHRSADVAYYRSTSRELSDVDFLFAHRSSARAMLERARAEELGLESPIKILPSEDLIGLKVQASTNDPRRKSLDMADIESLLVTGDDLDLERMREYFQIFNREAELDERLGRLRE